MPTVPLALLQAAHRAASRLKPDLPSLQRLLEHPADVAAWPLLPPEEGRPRSLPLAEAFARSRHVELRTWRKPGSRVRAAAPVLPPQRG